MRRHAARPADGVPRRRSAGCGALAGAGHGVVLPVTLGAACSPVRRSLLGRRRGSGAGLAWSPAAGRVRRGRPTAAGVRHERVAHNPLSRLAETRAGAVLTGDGRRRPAHDPGRGSATRCWSGSRSGEVSADGRCSPAARAGAACSAAGDWLAVPLGRHGAGRRPPRRRRRAATWRRCSPTSASPDIRAGPDPWWRAVGPGPGRAARVGGAAARRTGGRWCRPWSTATTPASTRRSPTTSGRPG